MELEGKHVVVTGGGGGIGRALALRFADEGARAVVVSDMDEANARQVAREVGGLAITADVGREQDIRKLINRAEGVNGPIDLFFSNAGITGPRGGPAILDTDWDRLWRVNAMSHVWAARVLLPGMLERGEGYLCSTASAAGLLAQLGAIGYTVTKHAAVAVAEWLSMTYGDRGIKVSCLCPQGVNTNMLRGSTSDIDRSSASAVRAGGDVLEPEQVADVVVQAIRDETFLILPHPEVAEYLRRKASDPDRWLGGMRRLQARVRSKD